VGEDQYAAVRRTTVAEAAQVLGISAEAVRGRIRRGTLPVDREGGTVYVLLEQPSDDRTDLLIAELQDRVRSLEEANRENRRIIAALTSRIPQLPAVTPSEITAAPREEAAEAPESAEPRSSTGDSQSSYERPRDTAEFPVRGSLLRPWWKRVFRG
jgi:hypothetical protein